MKDNMSRNSMNAPSGGIVPLRQQSENSIGYTYESPLSTLDTIRTVNNIISGSTRSFERLNKYLSSQQQIAPGIPADMQLSADPKKPEGEL